MPMIKGVEVKEGDKVFICNVQYNVSIFLNNTFIFSSYSVPDIKIYPTKNQLIDALIEELESRRDKEAEKAQVFYEPLLDSEPPNVSPRYLKPYEMLSERIDELDRLVYARIDSLAKRIDELDELELDNTERFRLLAKDVDKLIESDSSDNLWKHLIETRMRAKSMNTNLNERLLELENGLKNTDSYMYEIEERVDNLINKEE